MTLIIDETSIKELVLPCKCGNEIDTAYRRERIVTQNQQTGYLDNSRHIQIECNEDFDELEREIEDEQINCEGCDREIEFGYSHANKQGRIFLGEDDTDFNPYKTFPDQKYYEKRRKRGWIRPDK